MAVVGSSARPAGKPGHHRDHQRTPRLTPSDRYGLEMEQYIAREDFDDHVVETASVGQLPRIQTKPPRRSNKKPTSIPDTFDRERRQDREDDRR